MGQLSDWAKKNSKTLILDDGETVEAVYQGYKIGVNPFDVEKEIAFYKLTIKQDGEDATKVFKSTSGKAARFFDELKPGARVKITRHGKGAETKYEFDELDGTGTVKAGEEDEPVPFE